MIYYILAIAGLTILFRIAYNFGLTSACSICAAVVVTWVGGIIALYSNSFQPDPLIIAILMGASLGAAAEKYGNSFGFIWKMGTVLLGLPAIYFLINKELYLGLLFALALPVITLFTHSKNNSFKNKKDIFKDCC